MCKVGIMKIRVHYNIVLFKKCLSHKITKGNKIYYKQERQNDNNKNYKGWGHLFLVWKLNTYIIYIKRAQGKFHFFIEQNMVI